MNHTKFPNHTQARHKLLAQLPKVDKVLSNFTNAHNIVLKNLITDRLESLRNAILHTDQDMQDIEKEIKNFTKNISLEFEEMAQSNIKTLINGSGIVAQTNLGRSIINRQILDEIAPILSSYNNLEYDMHSGTRGERYAHLRDKLIALCGCLLNKADRDKYDAIIVNNNASAVILILNTFSKDREVIISRGELVEIGGSFRIPEVMKLSNAILKEVGTTNKTHLKDYQKAINENSAVIMKAHKSNFYMDGFVSEVGFSEITKLAQENNIIDYYDVGSGYMDGFLSSDKCQEPSIQSIMKDMPSIISFSGDKLFAGAQCGIIIAQKNLIKQLKENHLLRALRVDKFRILITIATINAYLQNNISKIPSIHMLNLKEDELKNRAKKLLKSLKQIKQNVFEFSIIQIDGQAGGGSLPNIYFQSYGICVKSKNIIKLEKDLRYHGLITRIKSNQILIDTRCLLNEDERKITEIFTMVYNNDVKSYL